VWKSGNVTSCVVTLVWSLNIHALLADEGLASEALRDRLKKLLAPFPLEASLTKAAMIRRELCGDTSQLNAILDAARAVGLDLATLGSLSD
jgi:hypothetical protein